MNEMCNRCAQLGTACQGTSCADWTGCLYLQPFTTAAKPVPQKRYRDENGIMTMTTKQLVEATLDEARTYYQDGKQYWHQGRTYTLHLFTDTTDTGEPYEVAEFTSADGYTMVGNPRDLGTFLPDIASEGLEIIRV